MRQTGMSTKVGPDDEPGGTAQCGGSATGPGTPMEYWSTTIILQGQRQLKLTSDTGMFFIVFSCLCLSLTLWASPFGGAESLAPPGAKDAAEPKGLAGAPG